MSYKEALYADFRKFFGLPEGAEILTISEECNHQDGCDTCGYGECDTFYVAISYIDSGKRRYKSVDGNLVEFLQSI